MAKGGREFDRTRVRITAFVEYEFEHFQITDPTCASREKSDFDVWVAFGGDVSSGAIYCCPGEGNRSITEPSKNARYPLVADTAFREFSKLLHHEGDTTVHATVVGTLLLKPEADKTVLFGGYGHMGCCHLLVIEQIESFEPHDSLLDFDYSSSWGRSEGRTCEYNARRSEPRLSWNEALALQRAADSGGRSWAFDEPARVAREALQAKHGAAVSDLVRVKRAPGREVFEWRHDRSWTTVVVIRPYVLSHFSKTGKVGWVASHMQTDTCAFLINPDADVRAQVLAIVKKFTGEQRIDPRLPADALANPLPPTRPGPKKAVFFDLFPSYAVAVEMDDRGWPTWIDVRPKSSYPTPIEVWPFGEFFKVKDIDIDVPFYRDDFERFVALFDSLRPLGRPTGLVRRTADAFVQDFEHAVLTWEEKSERQDRPAGVPWFSVKWR